VNMPESACLKSAQDTPLGKLGLLAFNEAPFGDDDVELPMPAYTDLMQGCNAQKAREHVHSKLHVHSKFLLWVASTTACNAKDHHACCN
jgi:hypothetical protein